LLLIAVIIVASVTAAIVVGPAVEYHCGSDVQWYAVTLDSAAVVVAGHAVGVQRFHDAVTLDSAGVVVAGHAVGVQRYAGTLDSAGVVVAGHAVGHLFSFAIARVWGSLVAPVPVDSSSPFRPVLLASLALPLPLLLPGLASKYVLVRTCVSPVAFARHLLARQISVLPWG
jgi:hypothetical protein